MPSLANFFHIVKNLTQDLDATIRSIQYNSLNLSLMNVGCGSEKPKQVWFFAHISPNLPIMITFTDGSTTQYTYDATGLKVMTGGTCTNNRR